MVYWQQAQKDSLSVYIKLLLHFPLTIEKHKPFCSSLFSLKLVSYMLLVSKTLKHGKLIPDTVYWIINHRFKWSLSEKCFNTKCNGLNISVPLTIMDELAITVSCLSCSNFCQFSSFCLCLWMSTRGSRGHSWSSASGWPILLGVPRIWQGKISRKGRDALKSARK